MPTLAVTVTAADVLAGRPQSLHANPVALALLRELPGAAVLVTRPQLVVYRAGAKFTCAVPAVTEFLAAFDRRQPVEPFTFALDLPDSFPPEPAPC